MRFPGQSLVGALAITAEVMDPLPADPIVIPFGIGLIASDPLWQLLPQYAQQLDALRRQAAAARPQSSGQAGNTANLDPNDPRFKHSIVKDLQRIYDRYTLDSGNCDLAAQKAFDKLTGEGYQAQIARFQIKEGVAGKGMRFLQLNDGRVISSSRGATGAFHDIVRVGNRVFDALTGPEGMLFEEYMAKYWSDMYQVEKTIELVAK